LKAEAVKEGWFWACCGRFWRLSRRFGQPAGRSSQHEQCIAQPICYRNYRMTQTNASKAIMVLAEDVRVGEGRTSNADRTAGFRDLALESGRWHVWI